MGVSPSGKATDFDSVIGGPTPPTPASHQILQTALCRIFCVARRTAARLPLIAYYCYPLTASQSFCIGRAIKGRPFYVQIKDQLRPTWRSYAGPPQQRRISVLPYASLADKSRSALFYNAPIRAPAKPSESSGQRPVHLKNLFTQPFRAACGEAADPAPEGR